MISSYLSKHQGSWWQSGQAPRGGQADSAHLTPCRDCQQGLGWEITGVETCGGFEGKRVVLGGFTVSNEEEGTSAER